MDSNQDLMGTMLRSYPRESAKIALLGIIGLWQSVAALLGLLVYLALSQNKCVNQKMILTLGGGLAIACVLLQYYLSPFLSLTDLLYQGWVLNKAYWHYIVVGENLLAAKCVFRSERTLIPA